MNSFNTGKELEGSIHSRCWDYGRYSRILAVDTDVGLLKYRMYLSGVVSMFAKTLAMHNGHCHFLSTLGSDLVSTIPFSSL